MFEADDVAASRLSVHPSSTAGLLQRESSLRVDGQVGEAGVDGVVTPAMALSSRVRLTWHRREEGPALGTQVELLDSAGRTLWEAVTGDDALAVEPDLDLEPYAEYSWRVRFADAPGWSEWDEQRFETGPLEFGDWRARWLEVPPTARIRTRFSSAALRSARLHLTGQGVVLAFVNGERVNLDRIDPSRTDHSRALYRTYDVTALIVDGENDFELLAGGGEWHKTGLRPRVLAEIVLRDEAGEPTWIAAGPASEVVSSEMTVDEPFYLERYDASAVRSVVPDPAVHVLDPVPGDTSLASPPSQVSADGSPPVRAVEIVDPRETGRVDGMRQYDVGTNIAGRSRIVIASRVPAGTTVSVIHGEHLDERGRIDTTNLTMPFDHGRERQVVERVLTGDAGESIEAWFAYHGFRYLEVRGLPDDAVIEVSARTIHTALPSRATVTTDSPAITRLMTAAIRTALNNVHSVPEDCPTREQAAWTGDAASANEFHFAQFDNASFVEKWLGDLVTSAEPDGALPAVAPDLSADRMPADPVWGAALHRALWSHWLNVGDLRVLRRFLPTLRMWAAYQAGCIGESGLADGFPISYGQDWLALEQTPPALIHSAAVIETFERLADLERIAGVEADGVVWRARATALRARIREVFYDARTRSVATGSQGSLAIALEAGILTPDESKRVADDLAGLVRRRGNRVESGFALTRTVVRALSHSGHSQTILDCLHQPDEPGIGAMISKGPGTFWENWWIDPKNTGTGSLDHVGLGAPFAAWVWECVVGVRPVEPGYRAFEVKPVLLDGITRVEATVSTTAGEIFIGYERTAGALELVVEVPVGTRARVTMPGAATTVVEAGRHRFTSVAEPESSAIAPQATPRWSAPAPWRATPDTVGALTLLERSRVAPGRGAPSIDRLPRLVCMPIPHPQFDHEVFLVRSSIEGVAPSVLLEPDAPVSIDEARFVYALTDECLDSAARSAQLFIVAHFDDGSERKGTARVWPAGWNRVSVDIAQATGRLTRVEVGLEFEAGEAGNALGVYPEANHSAFHLGEVGVSRRAPRW